MAEGSSTVPDLETQKNEIANIAKKPLEKNDIWCLMDNKWFKQWKKYVGYDSWETSCVGDRATHPGPIDNSPLLKDDGSGEIKDHLIDELDYVLLPKEGWDLLSQWYGVIEGQNCISRKVVEYGMFVKHCKVEVYLLEFKLCQNHDMEHFVTQKFSKVDTIGYIEQEMRRIFKIPEEKETRLWNRYSTNTFEHLNTRESTVQDIGLYQGQVIIIEIRNDDGSWPRQVKNTSAAITYTSSPVSASGDNRQMYNNPTSTVSTRSFASVGGSGSYNSSNYNCDYTNSGSTFVHPGLCGLSNLGNTCFMNSALQCMSNTPLLTDYFLKDQYLNELNVENPLGMRGEIAKSYADLVKMIWSGRFAYTTPRHFKTMVGRFAPQFSGYQQQDCQELMAFLLDGLHEDLNRVKKKPYIELRDDDGRSDEIVSKEAWENYLKRNNSIIVDIFHGLLKSTLVCPQCSKVSVTFDPFCYLSLPLPLKKEKQQEIRFVPADSGRRPMNMKVTVPKHGCISDLCEAVSKTVGIPANNLIVTDVYSHRIHKIFDSGESLANITDRDKIYVYESPMNLDSCGNSLFLPVYLKEKRHKAGMTYGAGPSQLFGHPMFVLVHNKSCTYDDLYETILNNMKRFAHNPSSEEDSEYIESIEEEKMNAEVEMANGDDYHSDQADQGIEKNRPDDVHNVNKSDEFRLFNVQSVNSVGSVEVEKLSNDGSLLILSNSHYIKMTLKGGNMKTKLENFEMNNEICRLKNIKNTCYMNSALQILFSIESFKMTILCREIKGSSKSLLTDSLTSLFFLMLEESVVCPEAFKDSLGICIKQFDNDNQNDAIELILLMLTQLEKESESNKEEFAGDTFRGILNTIYDCSKCCKSTSQATDCYIISISGDVSKKSIKSTQALVNEHFQPHIDYYTKCPKCNSFLKEKIELLSLPEILLVQLPRFVENTDGSLEKADVIINAEEKLTLIVENLEHDYELKAVMHHISEKGITDSGHYLVHLKNKMWIEVNDDNIKELKEYKSKTKTSYLLVYSRKNFPISTEVSHETHSGIKNSVGKRKFEFTEFQEARKALKRAEKKCKLKHDALLGILEPLITCKASKNSLLWHFIIEGPPETPYENGLYYGTLEYTETYPFKPPTIKLLTPSGIFTPNEPIRMKISSHHPDLWNLSWTTSSILTGLISSMVEPTPTVGVIETTVENKISLRKASYDHNLQDPIFCELFPDFAEMCRVRKDQH